MCMLVVACVCVLDTSYISGYHLSLLDVNDIWIRSEKHEDWLTAFLLLLEGNDYNKIQADVMISRLTKGWKDEVFGEEEKEETGVSEMAGH